MAWLCRYVKSITSVYRLFRISDFVCRRPTAAASSLNEASSTSTTPMSPISSASLSAGTRDALP